MSSAKDLVKVGKDIEREFGIPIVNKRVSVTQFPLLQVQQMKMTM